VNATDITDCTDGAITLRTPPHAVGTVNVVVKNPSGQPSTGGTNAYTYSASTDQPVINGLSVTRGTTLGGTLMVINGPAKFYCDVDGPKPAVFIGTTAVDPEDVELLQDLVLAAFNEALRSAQELQQRKLGAATGGLGDLAGGLGLPGM